MRLVPGYLVWVAVRCSHSCAIAVVARCVGRGSSRTVNVSSLGSISPLPVNAWRMRVWASWLARAYPVWTRTSRARAVAVLNAAMRIAWVISLVWMSRTCWPGLTWPSGSRAGTARLARWSGYRFQQGGVCGGQCPVVACPCGQELFVDFLLGRVGDHPGRVILRGGIGVVGVEVEVHPGVAEVVLLAPPRAHPVDDLFNWQVTSGGQDVDLSGAVLTALAPAGLVARDQQAHLPHREHFVVVAHG